jgi:protein SCO1/2
MSSRFPIAAIAMAALTAACAKPAREYELRGVVVSVDHARQQITIKHEDIPRFMPGMTMPFKVRDAALLTGRVPGDVVRATLIVEESDAHLRAIERTGTAAIPESSSTPPAEPLAAGAPVPDAAFIDQDGHTRHLADWRGHVLAVTFIYTRCPIPNFCPLMDRHFQRAQQLVKEVPALRGRVRLLSVTFDPGHDTPAVLAARARQLEADPSVWTFLTGDLGEIDRFAALFGVSVIRDDTPAHEILHNLRTVIIDASGRVSGVLGGNEWTPSELVDELRTAVDRR